MAGALRELYECGSLTAVTEACQGLQALAESTVRRSQSNAHSFLSETPTKVVK